MNTPPHHTPATRKRPACKRPAWLPLAVAALLAVLPGVPAQAAVSTSPADVRLQAMSLEEAADQVRGAYGGQVIAASPARAGGREGYRIRVILDDGRVITVFVDAESGAMRQTG